MRSVRISALDGTLRFRRSPSPSPSPSQTASTKTISSSTRWSIMAAEGTRRTSAPGSDTGGVVGARCRRRIAKRSDPWGVTPSATESFTVTAPTTPGTYQVLVSGGMMAGGGGGYYDYSYGYSSGGGSADEPESFEELLDSIETGYSNTDLVVSIYAPEDGGGGGAVSDTVRPESDIVEGYRFLRLKVTA